MKKYFVGTKQEKHPYLFWLKTRKAPNGIMDGFF